MTRWSAITRTRRSCSALAYGSRSTAAAEKTSTGSYTTSGDATATAESPVRGGVPETRYRRGEGAGDREPTASVSPPRPTSRDRRRIRPVQAAVIGNKSRLILRRRYSARARTSRCSIAERSEYCQVEVSRDRIGPWYSRRSAPFLRTSGAARSVPLGW